MNAEQVAILRELGIGFVMQPFFHQQCLNLSLFVMSSRFRRPLFDRALIKSPAKGQNYLLGVANLKI